MENESNLYDHVESKINKEKFHFKSFTHDSKINHLLKNIRDDEINLCDESILNNNETGIK